MPENYRPISILPAISKIMERILYNQLYNYLTEYGLLSSAQFGFRNLTLQQQLIWTVQMSGI